MAPPTAIKSIDINLLGHDPNQKERVYLKDGNLYVDFRYRNCPVFYDLDVPCDKNYRTATVLIASGVSDFQSVTSDPGKRLFRIRYRTKLDRHQQLVNRLARDTYLGRFKSIKGTFLHRIISLPYKLLIAPQTREISEAQAERMIKATLKTMDSSPWPGTIEF